MPRAKNLTCRNCGKPIYEAYRDPEARSWVRRWWSHTVPDAPVPNDYDSDTQAVCADGKRPMPAQVCCYGKTDGMTCDNPVKHEDMEGGVFSCGVHMKRYLDDIRRAEELERAAQKRREKEEMDNYELGIYQDAYDRLTVLNPELFPAAERPDKGSWRRWSRDVTLDIVEMERWFRNNVQDRSLVES